MPEDNEFVEHRGTDNPIRGRHGAIVKLRSGEMAIVSPRDDDEFDFDFETVWFQTGEDDDVVAYKKLPMLADEIIREIETYFRCEEALANDPIKDHHLMKLASYNRRNELRKNIAEYKKQWPNDPSFVAAKRLTEWVSDAD